MRCRDPGLARPATAVSPTPAAWPGSWGPEPSSPPSPPSSLPRVPRATTGGGPVSLHGETYPVAQEQINFPLAQRARCGLTKRGQTHFLLAHLVEQDGQRAEA